MGTIASSDAVKKAYAKASVDYNLKNQVFRKHFEDQLGEASSAPNAAAAPSVASSSAPSTAVAPSSASAAPTTPSPTLKPATAPIVAPAGQVAPNQVAAGPKPTTKAAASKQRQKDQTICRAIFVMVAVALIAICLNRWL